MVKFHGAAGVALLLAALAVGQLAGGEKIKSGLQKGDAVEGNFEPLNVNGENAGQRYCLVCYNGLNPVVMIFAREVSEPLLKLIARIEAAAEKHRTSDLGCFVVFLSDQPGLDKQLAEIVKKHKLKHMVLSIDGPAGPEGYKVAKDADVTVVLYENLVVRANHAFKKGTLTDQAMDAIVADVPKILPKK
jgi:hypothetical protein